MNKVIYDTINGYDFQDYKEFLIQNRDFENDLETEVDDQEVYDYIIDSQQIDFDNEYNINLNIELDEEIIAIANIGLWNGPKKGYKLLGYNIRNIFNCFESCDYISLYSDGKNIQGKGIHHDGTNCITYRKIRNDISKTQRQRLIDDIYNNDDNVDNYIKNYTRSLVKDINPIYGW